MLKCLIALTSLFSATALAVPVWTWVDEAGRRHYSDRPVEGATQIEVGPAQTFSGVSAEPSAQPAATDNRPAAPAYPTLRVVSPASQETLVNIGGELNVSLAIAPALQTGHFVDVILDGERQFIGSRTSTLTIPEVVRGEHTIQAVIVDADGEEIVRSMPVTFFVRQNSIQIPPPAGAVPRPTLQPPPGSNAPN